MGTPPNKDMLAGAQGTDRYKQFQSNLANSGFGNWTRPTTPPDPATLAAWQKLVPGSGVQVNAGTPPPTVPAGPPLPPTTNDAAMGPSYMPAQPSMAGAPVNYAPPPAPVAPKKPTPKKPVTPDPAQSMGLTPEEIQKFRNQLALQKKQAESDAAFRERQRTRGRPGGGYGNYGGGRGGNYGSSGPSSGGGRLA